MQKPVGVLLMAYGTPRSLEEVEPYYTHIRRGRPPTPELLAELVGRYQAIGGISPLNEITRAQGKGLEDALNEGQPGRFRVFLGMKHAHPFIAETVEEMKHEDIEEAVTLVLAPHYSTMSVASYQHSADEAVADGGPKLLHVDSWHLHKDFIALLAKRVEAAIAKLPNPDKALVIFSAHSLPERILSVGDPYPQQLEETGRAVAELLGLSHFTFAWQSAGRTSEKWLGPDILDKLAELAGEGEQNVVVCPAGFVSDHLEVLYDVDIECQNKAKELGMSLVRTTSLNADEAFVHMLADVVTSRYRQER